MSSCSSEDGKDSSTITSDSESITDNYVELKKKSSINSKKFNVNCESFDRSTQSVLISNRLEDIIQCSNTGKTNSPADQLTHFNSTPLHLLTADLNQFFSDKNARILITSASYPFHVEWVNSEWSRKCGWSSDEILGDLTSFRNCRNIIYPLITPQRNTAHNEIFAHFVDFIHNWFFLKLNNRTGLQISSRRCD